MNPLEQLLADRRAARDARDPWSGLCAVATIDDQGLPDVRTLVLRDLDGRLALFVNATSPKWPQLQRTDTVAAMVYFGALNVQYRLQARTVAVPEAIVHDSWLMRPDPPKRMDWFYSLAPETAQSMPVASRAELLDRLTAIPAAEELTAPDTARGLYLDPRTVERLDLNQDNGVHDRRLYTLDGDGAWHEQVLVP